MSDIMTVGQIAGLVERDEHRLHTSLGDITVAENGRKITIKTPQVDGDESSDMEPVLREFEFDEVVERSFSKFLDVNPTYMSKCPSELKAYNFNYWLKRSPEVQAMLMVGPKGIETMYDPDDTIVTVPEIAGVISRVFSPEDQITTLYSDPDKFHVDIQVGTNIQVDGNGLGDRPTPEGLLIRPGEEIKPEEAPRVFDITHGGVRIISHPSKAKAPTIERYFNRLICTNGVTMPVPDRRVTLRGNTVQEVLAEIESIAEQLMADMPRALQSYADLAQMEVPGNPLAYIRQIGKEMGIPERIIGKALDYAGAANFGRAEVPVTSYDVLQIFTSLANNDSVRYETGRKLQHLGGVLVHRGEEMNHRCAACERPLL